MYKRQLIRFYKVIFLLWREGIGAPTKLLHTGAGTTGMPLRLCDDEAGKRTQLHSIEMVVDGWVSEHEGICQCE